MEKLQFVAPPEWGLPLLDARPDAIALLDAEGVILHVNAAWRRFALDNGIRADDSVPGPGIDYLTLCEAARGESAQGAVEAASGIRAVLARRLPTFSLEYPCHSPERQRWFLMMVSPLDLAGAAAMVSHLDITERKLEELRRRDSELRLNMALDATGDGLWDWNLQTGQTYLSPSYYALTGYRAADEPGSLDFFQRLVHPDDWPQVTAVIEAHLRGDTPVSEVEYRMITANCDIRWIRGRGRVAERDATGSPLRMVGLITDITAFKHIEQALKESEARYRTVVEDQTEVICRIAIDGTIVFANAVFQRLFGKTAAEVIGQKWQPVAHPDDVPMIEARLEELTVKNPVVAIENRVLAADGSQSWMQFVNRGHFDSAGRLLEIQVVGRDITERNEIEAQQRELLNENAQLSHELMQLQETERAALAKQLHDELSQQLVAIRAYAGAIARRTDDPEHRTHLDAMAIGNVASDIYTISHRMMEGLHPQALENAGLVGAIAGLVDHCSKAHPDVRVRLRTSPLRPDVAELNIQLFRIVQECLANAIQHGHARRIRIFVGERVDNRQRLLRIVVSDDGIGLPPDAPRTGYGLIIMRGRARDLGGSLDLRSQPGRGLRVAVDVPITA